MLGTRCRCRMAVPDFLGPRISNERGSWLTRIPGLDFCLQSFPDGSTDGPQMAVPSLHFSNGSPWMAVPGWQSLDGGPWMAVPGWQSLDGSPWMAVPGWQSLDGGPRLAPLGQMISNNRGSWLTTCPFDANLQLLACMVHRCEWSVETADSRGRERVGLLLLLLLLLFHRNFSHST